MRFIAESNQQLSEGPQLEKVERKCHSGSPFVWFVANVSVP
jgi:hypothetical protein